MSTYTISTDSGITATCLIELLMMIEDGHDPNSDTLNAFLFFLNELLPPLGGLSPNEAGLFFQEDTSYWQMIEEPDALRFARVLRKYAENIEILYAQEQASDGLS